MLIGGVVAIALLVTIVVVTTKCIQKETFNKTTNCICAFDIDHTLSCGNPKPLIDSCKQRGCILAINTARPNRFIADIPLNKYGFDYDPTDHYYQSTSYLKTAQQVGETKSQYLAELEKKYKVPDRKCIVLLDDAVWNLEAAKANGFSTVSASDTGECGLTIAKDQILKDILKKC